MKKMRFNPDQPIGANADEDLLDRRDFCSRIAELVSLSAEAPGLAVSLEGPWGSGKTSALNMIAHLLERTREPERAIIVRFNPWIVGSHGALAEELLLQLASSVGLSIQSGRASRLSQALVSYSRFFSFLKLVPGAGVYAEPIEKALKAGSDVATSAAELSKISIESRKKQVSEAITQLGKSIVIFIDDLDRLTPEEVLTMIRVVKAVSDFPMVTYVIAFDPSYVEAALDRTGIPGARSYLDKIIQVRVSLPRISTSQLGRIVDQQLQEPVFSEASKFFTGEDERVADLFHYAIKYLLRTPRDIYRTFNRLRISHPASKSEIGLADLFALETIAITAPPLYRHIRARPQAYVGKLKEDFGAYRRSDPAETLVSERDQALQECNEDLRAPLSDLLGRIFPLTAKGPKFEDEHPSRVTGRIACPENLLIALSSGLSTFEWSLSQVRSFVGEPSQRQAIIENIIGAEQLEDFLDLVRASLGRSHLPEPQGFLEALCELSKLEVAQKIDELRFTGRIRAYSQTQFFWVVRQVLVGQEPQTSRQLIDYLCTTANMLTLSTAVLEFLCEQQGLLSGRSRESESNWLVSAEELKALTAAWIRSTKGAFLEESAFNSKGAGPALYLLRKIDPQSLAEVARYSLQSAEITDKFMEAIGSGRWDSTGGSYAEIPETFLTELGDVEEFRRAARQRLDDAGLTSPALRAIYTSVISGAKQYFSNFEGGESNTT